MPGTMMERPVVISAGHVMLEGDLVLPSQVRGVVLFAHGSGSSRHSPRNRQVASVLNHAGLATLLMDLLTPQEELADRRMAHLRFDIELLGERLVSAIDWLSRQNQTAALPIGLFGASTGGGAALVAAAERPEAVAAVVSRGGRPDLAGDFLPHVTAPTLLLVGKKDEPVIKLNEWANIRLRCERELHIVPGATHLFEEPGALEEVAALACDWFLEYLPQKALVPVLAAAA